MLDEYLSYDFPLIPLARYSKAPVHKGWVTDRYPRDAFRRMNVGVRAGEHVNVLGQRGHLMILDYDAPDIADLRALCAELELPRTTTVRSGGQHHGYHLYYLTETPTSKHQLLAYRNASIDLLGAGSFAVAPPSVVNHTYRFLIGLQEISPLADTQYQRLFELLQQWKAVRRLVKAVDEGRLSMPEALAKLPVTTSAAASTAMSDYLSNAVRL